MPAAPARPTVLSRAAGLARAGARLPTSRIRRSRVLRRTLLASAIVHLLLVALFLLIPRAPAPDTAPDEPGIAMEFERPRPKGAASDAPQPHAGQGTVAPTPSRVQSDAPGTPSPAPPAPSPAAPQPSPLAPAPSAPDAPPTPAPPDAPRPDAQPLQQPPVPPPPEIAPDETAQPDADALPDAPPSDAAIAPVPSPAPAPAAPAPPTPQPSAVTQAPSPQPAGQPSPAPTPSPVQAPAPDAPEADVQVNAGPLAELFNLQPIPMPQPRPLPPQPQPPAPAPRQRAARPAPAFPTPQQWAFTPGAPGGGSPARGGSRGLNLSFAPQIHGGGGARSTPDFSAPDAGPDWENELHAWWDRHGYFPREAAEAGEQGTVGLHLVVSHDGRVTAARLTTASGSVWLDQGALALFRDANLPPLPPQTDKPQIPVDLRIHYILR